jgi:molybdopterin-guanine dinucleotide biosynthesis protein A
MATRAGAEQSGHSGNSGPLAAVVLAGGRATRLGGADKPAITIQGRSLLSTAVWAALNAGVSRVVIVGPPRPGLIRELAGEPPRSAGVAVEFTTEQPPGAGPVPAVRAGLELISEPWLLLLAADLPFLRGVHLSALLAAARTPAVSGAIFVDHHGHPQWLAGCWQTARLRTALGGYEGSSLGGLLGPLAPVRITAGAAAGVGVQGEAPPWFDCDTSDDVAAALALAAHNRSAGDQEQPTEE